MAMADVRIDMETALYEQMAALCAKLGTTVEAVAGRFCEEFVRMEAPPVPESYASMSVEDKIDFIAQNSEGVQFQVTRKDTPVRIDLTGVLFVLQAPSVPLRSASTSGSTCHLGMVYSLPSSSNSQYTCRSSSRVLSAFHRLMPTS